MMKEKYFAALVERLEMQARNQPQSYKIRVGFLAACGYAYIFLILLGSIAGIFSLIWLSVSSERINSGVIKSIVFLTIPAFIAIRSLWISFPPPKGLELKRDRTPRLFATLDRLAHSLKTPKIDRVVLTSDFNASARRFPRLGMLGWHRNYLIFGLPLLQALSLEQFESVIAHELGHLSGSYNRFSNWIYQVRTSWFQIYNRLEQSQHWGSNLLFGLFFNWYAPFFGAYSFVLARANEYEADRHAAELVGSKHTASALVNVSLKARFLEEYFWRDVYKQADLQPDPPANIFTELAELLKSKIHPERERQLLWEALLVQTGLADTHPCLMKRLEAIGTSMQDPTLGSRIFSSRSIARIDRTVKPRLANNGYFSVERTLPLRPNIASTIAKS